MPKFIWGSKYFLGPRDIQKPSRDTVSLREHRTHVSQTANSSKETGRSVCGMQNARLCNPSSWMEGVCSQREAF